MDTKELYGWGIYENKEDEVPVKVMRWYVDAMLYATSKWGEESNWDVRVCDVGKYNVVACSTCGKDSYTVNVAEEGILSYINSIKCTC